MENNKINIGIGVLVLILVAWMLKGTFTQPGVEDLKSGFKEVARYRNDNNTGPIQYVFAVTMKDTLSSDMITYGNFKPHHKGGNTKVYYFMEGTKVPTIVTGGKQNFLPEFNDSWVLLFEKSAMGNVSLTKNPNRQQ
jgi:hypothetical protein